MLFIAKNYETSWWFQNNVIPLHSQNSKNTCTLHGDGGIAQLVRASDS